MSARRESRTNEGHLPPPEPRRQGFAVVLMFMGVALFGAIAATLPTVFQSDTRQSDALLVQVARLEAKIDQLVEGRAAEG